MKKAFAIIVNLVCYVCGYTDLNYEKSESFYYREPAKILKSKENFCQNNETCVRFCCDDKLSCLDEKLFNLSSVFEARNLGVNIKILMGRPICESMYENEDPWEFRENGDVVQILNDKELNNNYDQYCFDRKNDTSRMLICHGDEDSDSENESEPEEMYPICKGFVEFCDFLLLTFRFQTCCCQFLSFSRHF